MFVCTLGRGKGFLAADESAGPWLRARHAEAAKIPDTGRVKTGRMKGDFARENEDWMVFVAV